MHKNLMLSTIGVGVASIVAPTPTFVANTIELAPTTNHFNDFPKEVSQPQGV